MRAIDWKLAVAVRDHWQGIKTPEVTLCALLVDLDRLLAYLDNKGLKPGHSIARCPECDDEHRWTLLKALMCSVLDLYPDRHSALLKEVDQGLESVRAMYGGKEQYQEMLKEAEAYFAKVGADNCYVPH